MGWESDQEAVEISTDLSRYVLFGIVGLVVVMIGILFVTGGSTQTESEVRVSHILKRFDKRDEASRQQAWEAINQIKQELDAGAEFARMAREHTDDESSRNRNGDLGWVMRDELVPEFEEIIWVAELGSVSGPVETQYGFHLIHVIDRNISDAELYDRNLNQRVLERNQQQ